jgi:hypothetical protein
LSESFLQPNSPIEDWPPETRRAYERECLREVKEQLQRVADSEYSDVMEVSRDGCYPNTRIVIKIWDRALKKEVTSRYPIWTDKIFAARGGGRAAPTTGGMLMTTWALGG